MSEMVERVARALSSYRLICTWRHEDDDFDSSGSEYEIRGEDGSVLKITGEIQAAAKYDELRARAAIEAMRTPTHEMIERGHQDDPLACDVPEDEIEYCYGSIWRGMCDAALSPAKED